MHTLTRLTLESLQVFNRTSARVRRAARGIRKRNRTRTGGRRIFRRHDDLYDENYTMFRFSDIKLYSQTKPPPRPCRLGGGGGVVAMDRTRRGPLSRSWTSPLRLGQAAHGAVEPRDGTARRAYPGEEPQFDQNPGHLISLQMEAPSLYGHKVGSSTELLLA